MKNISLIIVLLCSTFFSKSIAQEIVEQGRVVYEVTNMKSIEKLDPSTESMIKDMIDEMKLTLNFKPGICIGEIDIMGMKMKTKVEGDEFIIYQDMMGQKSKIDGKALAQKMIDNGTIEKLEPTVTYFDEYKEILGYKCQKVTVSPTVKSNSTMLSNVESVTMFVTDQIKSNYEFIEGQYLGDLVNGFALEYSSTSQGFEVTMTAVSIDENALEDVFEIMEEEEEEYEWTDLDGGHSVPEVEPVKN